MKTLNEIGLLTKTDKANAPDHGHGYLDFYEKFLAPLRNVRINLLEIGIGGYKYEDKGGESLRMWREYFTHGTIIGVDIHPKSPKIAPECFIIQGSQNDPFVYVNILSSFGEMDVIIDDASHNSALSIDTFHAAFALLKPGGIYIWEDTHTSLWAGEYGGNPKPLAPATSLHFLSRLNALKNEPGNGITLPNDLAEFL